MLLIGKEIHPDYPLIIAANRDEKYDRPTESAAWRTDAASSPPILSGKDLSAGGTWLGISRSGRLGAITNYWGPEKVDPDAPSRGRLVNHFIQSSSAPADYAHMLEGRRNSNFEDFYLGGRYNGFNMVMGNVDSLWYYTNADGEYPRPVQDGIHVISNDVMDTPWPKARTAVDWLQRLVRTNRLTSYSLLDLLSYTVEEDRQKDPVTPREKALELAKTSIRIQFPRFGTRSSSVLLIDRDCRVRFIERCYFPLRESEFSFTIT